MVAALLLASVPGTSRSRYSSAQVMRLHCGRQRRARQTAEQTTLIAAEAVSLLHEAVYRECSASCARVWQTIGKTLVSDETHRRRRHDRVDCDAKIIAGHSPIARAPSCRSSRKTGGQNAMFVDSTGTPEQVVTTVIRSAFHSAGQRCSPCCSVSAGRDRRTRAAHDQGSNG